MKSQYRFSVVSGSAWVVEFETDDEAFQYATGCDDNGRTSVEKQIEGMWHRWDRSTQRWVSDRYIWGAAAVELFEKLCGTSCCDVRGRIQKLAELLAPTVEIKEETVIEAVRAYLGTIRCLTK